MSTRKHAEDDHHPDCVPAVEAKLKQRHWRDKCDVRYRVFLSLPKMQIFMNTIMLHNVTRSSAIAERPRCRVR